MYSDPNPNLALAITRRKTQERRQKCVATQMQAANLFMVRKHVGDICRETFDKITSPHSWWECFAAAKEVSGKLRGWASDTASY